jgi:hypothetical protein
MIRKSFSLLVIALTCTLMLMVAVPGCKQLVGAGIVTKVNANVGTEQIVQACATIKAGEDAVLILAANHQLSNAWLAQIKIVIPLTQPTCNALVMPTSIPAAQYTALLNYGLTFTNAQANPKGSPPPQ